MLASRQTQASAFTCNPVARRAAVRPALGMRPRARPTAAVSVRAEISYIMVKPDGVQRGLVGDIISRFERKGYKLTGLKLYQTPREVAEEHYKDLSAKPFYKDLVNYILSGPVVCMVWEGKGVVATARKMIGATNPLASEPGTIRGDFAIEVGRNVIHGSDSPENGEREAALWFKDGLVAWDQTMTPWLKE
ncbi:Nucleoside diphosphate kinase II, chloroplastic [Pleodorina starrii]|uniref:Nucleoside diphosphate kinase n=1 Tax=Pleodorina starrii TaxID=330485 RepID=A0A9W6EZC2_9CHLO|nr:Nucleoside diphosphate kinase II [Pleodorina starrii]GLC50459.1 Nucleoside diphosphate kinase II, chloroplastic [Pleodorina starrii]GLC73304.1 Nucleoside diphosphate kinase II [Pleodorina starrii]